MGTKVKAFKFVMWCVPAGFCFLTTLIRVGSFIRDVKYRLNKGVVKVEPAVFVYNGIRKHVNMLARTTADVAGTLTHNTQNKTSLIL